jgi:hypothetical protein
VISQPLLNDMRSLMEVTNLAGFVLQQRRAAYMPTFTRARKCTDLHDLLQVDWGYEPGCGLLFRQCGNILSYAAPEAVGSPRRRKISTSAAGLPRRLP